MKNLLSVGKNVYMKEGTATAIKDAQCIFFDCDGVLVDVRCSYDETICKTVDILLERFAGVKKNPVPITVPIIDAFKVSGGFNDEVDLAYAASLCIAHGMSEEYVLNAAQAADSTGLESVEKYLADSPKAAMMREKLAYPADGKGIVYDIFDSVFYGDELYASLDRNDVGVRQKPGLVERDKIILDSKLALDLKSRFGRKPGIVTGRGMFSISHTLGDLLENFDLKNSAFLEDEPRKMAKPNPESLIRCMEGMGIENAIFVGDSSEDLLLAQRACESGRTVTFCGIIGTSLDPRKKLELFDSMGAQMAVDSVLLLPEILSRGS